MIYNPIDILSAFPVRKSWKQKQAFRNAVQAYVAALGYNSRMEKGSLGARNLVIGDPEKAQYLITAHYDTCARLLFPNLITPCNFWAFLGYQLFIVAAMFAFVGVIGGIVYFLTKDDFWAYWMGYISIWVFLILMLIGPANQSNANDNTSGVVAVLEIARTMTENLRDKVCFVLFDLEEVGLIGSISYRSTHKKASTSQIVFNLDCIGDGDEILFFPTGKLRRDNVKMTWLTKACGVCGKKSIAVCRKGFFCYPSDQVNFPLGVGICALRRSKWAGLYLGRIHTNRDANFDATNINILRACLTSLVSSGTAKYERK